MKSGLAVMFFAASCAQPDGTPLERVHDLGGRQLMFDDDGGSAFSPHDMAMAARDLSRPPDLTPPSNVDAGSTGSVDMAHATCGTVENCFNDLDDDCDGVVNNGCPDTVSVGADHALASVGGTGGGATTIHCPANQIAIGIRVYYDDYDGYISGMGIACSPLALVRGTSSYTIQLTMPTQVAGQFEGADTDDGPEDDPCDTTQLQTPWSHIIDTHTTSKGTYVNGVLVDCGQGALTLSPTNQLSLSFTDLNNQFGWEYGARNGSPEACGASEGLVGYSANYGSWIDRLQPICAPIVFTYK